MLPITPPRWKIQHQSGWRILASYSFSNARFLCFSLVSCRQRGGETAGFVRIRTAPDPPGPSTRESTACRSLTVKARQSWETAVMETQQRKARVQQAGEKGERPREEEN